MRIRMNAAGLLVGAALGLGVLGPAPAPAADKGSASYRYTYYPAQRIYHDDGRDIWYWHDGRAWNSGTDLPRHLQQFTTRGVKLTLPTRTPYERQDWVEQRHGRPAPYQSAAETRALQRDTAAAR